MTLSHDIISGFVESQLELWPLARENYRRLGATRRRILTETPFPIAAQYNPARIVSTGAAVDKDSIFRRKCFLCSNNRPSEQFGIKLQEGWELLINPFPIFPIHLTIVSLSHTPQKGCPPEIITFAEQLPSMTVFFNGAQAGASAPDHLHLQAVLSSELPLIRFVSHHHQPEEGPVKRFSQAEGLPFCALSLLVAPSLDPEITLSAFLKLDQEERLLPSEEAGRLNLFAWIDDNSMLRILYVPRRAHRPRCWYLPEEDRRLMVSPGAIDIAGIMILPRESDFKKITLSDALDIFSETTFSSFDSIINSNLEHGKR